jgi:DNA double-strand break repair helicase HerA and related ATPase
MVQRSDLLIIAKGKDEVGILPRMANRHGLVAGATGTGKTVTLRVMAEQFSRIGVPVFMADVKGDLSGMAKPGGDRPEFADRARMLGISDYAFDSCPTVFWDVFGLQGHPVRATISEMGPLLLARVLNLNDIQSGVLTLTFKIADDSGLLLLDLKDLRAIVQFVGENAEKFKTEYGNISTASVGAIQRGLLAIEEQGGGSFFGEPALNLEDLMQTNGEGRGVINILVADKLMQSPTLYATFLLWMLSELYENLPEVGDPDKPKLVFFFDEAHLLFNDTPRALEDKIELVIRLIRSKGVGVYFVTQNPLDVPEVVLGQLGNRVQHALRAFTPKDQKAVKAAAETFRAAPGLDVSKAITELAVGEALVSALDAKGTPTMVERAMVCPPRSRLTPLSAEERTGIIKASVLFGHYEKAVDRESAYEKLKQRTMEAQIAETAGPSRRGRTPGPESETAKLFGAMAKSAAHAVGSQIGRQIIRGVLGSIFGGSGKRR